MAVTPGNWYAKMGPAPFYRWYVRSTDADGNEYLVAKCHGDAEDDPGEATARLVAAAPTMLDILKGCASRWDVYDDMDDPGLGERIRSVISAAEGTDEQTGPMD